MAADLSSAASTQQREVSRRALQVGRCALCSIELPLGLMVPDGGHACADLRWYCKDAEACTDRWTGRDGVFRRPGELSLDDLPPTYARDEGLAQALGMLQPVVGLAARRLGVPAEVLWGLSVRPDLVAMVERELADGRGDQGER